MSAPRLPIVYGPQLRATPPKPGERRQPPSWNYNVRLGADLATQIDHAARAYGCKPADLIRTACIAFLGPQPLAEPAQSPPVSLTDQERPATHAGHDTPTQARKYRGDGRQDTKALIDVNRRNDARKLNGQAGERLKDTTSVR